MAQIYVSSTFTDLEEVRKQVSLTLRRLGYEDIAMEYYVAEDRRPLDRCLADVDRCDLYLGIFAWRYGFIPSGHDKSITELEYRRARERGKECLVFLLDEKAPWPMQRVEVAAMNKIGTLRAELQENVVAAFFTSEHDIGARVAEAVTNWERSLGRETAKLRPPLEPQANARFERLAYHIEPLEWRAVVRYRLDPNSIFSTYAERFRARNIDVFDMVGEYRPDRNNPREARAWDYLMRPRVYVAVLPRELFESKGKTLPVPILKGVPILLEANRHADRDGKWTPGPDARTPPFYSRMSFVATQDGLCLKQEFVIRESPEATRIRGVLSPVDLSGLLVVAETPQDIFAVVDRVIFMFPNAREEVVVDMEPTASIMEWNRTLGLLEPERIRTALNPAL